MLIKIFSIIALIGWTALSADSPLSHVHQYLKEQEQGKAFQAYLEELEKIPKNSNVPESTPEFRAALDIYLNPLSPSSKETAIRILKAYGATPKNNDIAFIQAAAYANLGQYDRFFDIFYQAYKVHPEHYLAYKEKALIYIKIYERASTPEQKEQLRYKVIENLQQALQRYPKDQGLYIMTLSFAPQDQKKKIVLETINKLIDLNIQVSRHEIDFYVGHALSVGELPLAQKFIQKAKQWYPYSRSIEAAEKYLEQHQGDMK